MADRKISDLTALTTPASGDYLPIVDISEAAAASKNKRITIEELMRGVPDGTAAAPGIAFETDPNTGIYSPGADQLAISTGGTARLTSSTTAISSALPIDVPLASAATPSLTFTGDLNTGIYSPGADQLAVATNGVGRLFVDASGNIDLKGATNQNSTLRLYPNGTAVYAGAQFFNSAGSQGAQLVVASGSEVYLDSGGNGSINYRANGTGTHVWFTNGAQKATIDSSGRLGIGNSAPQGVIDARADAVAATRVICNNATIADGASTNFDYYLNTTRLGGLVHGFNSGSTYFGIDTWNGSAATRRLTITAGGSLGIGTASPSELITGRGNIFLETNSTSADSGAGLFWQSTTSGWTSAGAHAAIYGKRVDGNNGYLRFDTRSGGTTAERARIDSSGRLLVGTSSTSQASTALLAGNSAGTDHAILRVTTKSSTPASGAPLGSITWGDSGHTTAAAINVLRDGGTWTSGSSQPTRLEFSVTADGAATPTERMRITSGGAVSTFVTATGGGISGFTSRYSGAAGTADYLYQGRRSATGMTGGTLVFLVFSNGDVQNVNNSYGAMSDIKLKENIVDANSQWNDLKALQVRKYNFKEGQTHTQIGLVAQEVELVSPGLVTESPDRDEDGNDLGTVTKSINYSVLYMKAVKALQEAMERIEQLEADVAQLKGA